MPMAGNAGSGAIAPATRSGLPCIARARKSCIKLAPDQRLDKIADSIAQAGFDRVKPVVEEINRRLLLRLIGITHRGSPHHGVVSCPAHQRWTRSG